MDEFEKRLKRDATAIDASVSPQLEERLAASLHSAGREVPVAEQRSPAFSRLWLASSLTGLAAAAAIMMFVYRTEPEIVEMPVVAETVPDYREYMEQLQENLPLRTETVEFADGLEEELTRLKADMLKARETVSRDLDFTF